MATITDFITSATNGFLAVATRRNADVAALNSAIDAVDVKADQAATDVATAQAAASSAATDADAAQADAAAAVAAVASKAPLDSPAFTGTPTGITKAHVGLGSVDNTADSAKPVSTAQATAIAARMATDLANANFPTTDFAGAFNGAVT